MLNLIGPDGVVIIVGDVVAPDHLAMAKVDMGGVVDHKPARGAFGHFFARAGTEILLAAGDFEGFVELYADVFQEDVLHSIGGEAFNDDAIFSAGEDVDEADVANASDF